MEPSTSIGVLGGSFDPVHRGHTSLALAARSALSLDRLLLVPAASQPLKRSGPIASAADRLAMAHLAAAPHREWLYVSDIEVRRGGASYTVQTLLELRDEFGPEAKLHFVAGADALGTLRSWRRWRTLLEIATFCVGTRPGHPVTVPPDLEEHIRFVALEPVALSSSLVRSRLASGDDCADVLGSAVAAYIRERGLYQSESPANSNF